MSKRLKDDIQISIMGGALFGFAIYLIMLRVAPHLWWLCFVAAVVLIAILVGYLVGYDRFVTRRYAAEEAKIPVPVRIRTMGNFHTELGKRTGYIYVCDDRIVLVSLDKRPHMTIEVLASDVESYEMPRLVQLNLNLKDGNYQTIHAGEIGQIVALLKKKKWGKK